MQRDDEETQAVSDSDPKEDSKNLNQPTEILRFSKLCVFFFLTFLSLSSLLLVKYCIFSCISLGHLKCTERGLFSGHCRLKKHLQRIIFQEKLTERVLSPK